jgi:hypothetical protein
MDGHVKTSAVPRAFIHDIHVHIQNKKVNPLLPLLLVCAVKVCACLRRMVRLPFRMVLQPAMLFTAVRVCAVRCLLIGPLPFQSAPHGACCLRLPSVVQAKDRRKLRTQENKTIQEKLRLRVLIILFPSQALIERAVSENQKFIAINLSDSHVQGLRIEQMPADGCCLFHALAHQIQRLNQTSANLTCGVFSFAFSFFV